MKINVKKQQVLGINNNDSLLSKVEKFRYLEIMLREDWICEPIHCITDAIYLGFPFRWNGGGSVIYGMESM